MDGFESLFESENTAPVSTGIVTSNGIKAVGESFSDSPSIAGSRTGGAGLSCVFMNVGRIPCKLADGGFHSP